MLALVVLVPYLYQDELKALLKEELNRSLEAHVDFDDVSISLLRRFPNLQLGIDGLYIAERQDSIVGDTISYVDEIGLTLDIISVIKSDETVVLEGFDLIRPRIFLKTYPDSSVNYNILKQESIESQSDTASGTFDIQLDYYSIEDAYIIYSDEVNAISVKTPNLNHRGSGSYNENILNIKTFTESPATDLRMNGQEYMTDLDLSAEMDLRIDVDTWRFDIEESTLGANDLSLILEGWLQSMEDGIKMDLGYNAPGNDFGELWSVIPTSLTEDYQDIQTSGEFTLTGFVRGEYNYETGNLPGIRAEVTTNNGSVVYSKLPQSLKNINSDLTYYLEESTNRHLVNIRQFDFDAGQSTFRSKGEITNNQRGTYIDGYLNSDLDLKDLPLDGQYSGNVRSDLKFSGDVDDIRGQNYERLSLTGSASLRDIRITDLKGLPDIEISSPVLTFNPKEAVSADTKLKVDRSIIDGEFRISDPLGFLIDGVHPRLIADLESDKIDMNSILESMGSEDSNEAQGELVSSVLPFGLSASVQASIDEFVYGEYLFTDVEGRMDIAGQKISIPGMDMTYGSNPINIEADLDNVATYMYGNGSLLGNVTVNSRSFDLNKFIQDGSEDTASSENGESAEGYVLPPNVSIDVYTNIASVKYNSYELKNLNGNLSLKEQQLDLRELTTDALGGQMELMGTFISNGRDRPIFNFKYDISKMPFSGVYENILAVRELVPLAKYIDGFFNSTLVVEGQLEKNMNPDLSSIDASGYIETLRGKLDGLPFLSDLSEKLAVKELAGIELEDTKNWFEIKDGEFRIEPFAIEHEGISIDVQGKTSLDKTLNLDLVLAVPREKIDRLPGGEAASRGLDWAQKQVSNLGIDLKNIDTYIFGVDISGKINAAKITIDMVDARSGSENGSVSEQGEKALEKIKDTLTSEKERIVEETKEKVKEEVEEYGDTLRSQLEKESEKAREKVGKKIKELIDSTDREKVGERTGEDLKKEADEKVRELEKKLEEFNPFKKKK
ncbi:MAG: AsmA-like C-terminal region-containing protein [Saprospiraceae bacterium]|nr:AsmA-like C-terminal region-containing protein [Saprospiraceae bacterium]